MSKVQRPLGKRLTAWLLVCALLLGLAPAVELGGAASAAYADSYMQQMVDWGFMRGDIEGNLRPDDPITRAEFVTIVNRSFGYEAMEGHPFDDVDVRDWYNDDVDISYTEGYISGTSEHTFSPGDSITREEAAVILARNLMLQSAVGEDTSFSDSRELDEWSRGYVATAARYQLLNGYEDGSFRPKNPITRGEAAILMTRAIGTPVQEAGVHELGSTWGNVTITESGVTLRNTVVGGNLYITAGVELGSVTLENVRVLGEIIVSGGGLSEGGDDSIVFRNVDAPKLIVDNLRNQQVSLRVEGNGIIDNTSVRTDAFVTDNTQAGYGLSRIELDGEADELSLHLSGNGKEVVNKTPGSALSVDSGRVESITVDEAATDSTLHIAAGAEVESVYLDVGTEVTGEGDIGHLTVNAPGSSVSMLPDQITIRPGIEADIDGETMDSAAAAESSADPRLLSGYPSVTDLAPTTATAQFSANKRGTVHWAVTSVTDGSATVDELLNPPAYTNKIVQNGTLSLGGSGEVGTAALRNLTSDGSYYLAAVFVDAREEQSPLKVVSFTTPDNSVPAFADGYPYLSQITNISAQVTGMATKTCRLYWAVLPAGAAAPTAEDFKANAVSGNLGFGTLDVTKNVEFTFDANNVPLEELEDYVVYLWLNDVDGGQSSRVESLDFTTVDRTPPIFNTEATVNDVQRNSVGLYANLNEDGTLYWVVVAHGEEYPKPLAGQSGEVDLSSDTAKLQVANGMNALRSGSVRMTEGRDVSFTVSGLDPETAYDLYYVAQDTAGNYSDRVRMIEIHSLDPNAPTVTQEFTRYNGTDTTQPLSDTDVRLVFSEAVQTVSTHTPLVDLYQEVTAAVRQGEAAEAAARDRMAAALSEAIHLYYVPGNAQPEKLDSATADTDKKDLTAWTIDYRYAEITIEEGRTVVTFPNGTGINLRSGAEYYFEIQPNTIADTSTAANPMGTFQLDRFTTVFAIVNLSTSNISTIEVEGEADPVQVNAVWRLNPVSTERVEDTVDWDMLIWTDTNLSFNLYRRFGDGAWVQVGNERDIVISSTTQGMLGLSLTLDFLNPGETMVEFDPLNELQECEYAMEFTVVEGQTDKQAWNGRVNVRVDVVAGTTNNLRLIATDVSEGNWNDTVVSGVVSEISSPEDFNIVVPFSDQSVPYFTGGYPQFDPGATDVTMSLMLNRPGTIYYVVAPRTGGISTLGPAPDNKNYNADDYEDLPEDGALYGDNNYPLSFVQPQVRSILNPEASYSNNPNIKYGDIECQYSVLEATVDGLIPETEYIVYFVIQNTAQNYSEVQCYRFETTDVGTPYITLYDQSPGVEFKTSEDSELNYILVAYNQVPPLLKTRFETVATDAFTSTHYYTDNPDMTILDALLTTVPSSTSSSGSANEGPSLFDEYALRPEDDSNIRTQVGDLIRRGQSVSPVTSGSMTTEADISQIREFEEFMSMTTLYYCIAVAHNMDGIEDGFKAIEGINRPDRTPPTINVSGTSVQRANGTWAGTVTIEFSENLYWLSEDRQTLKEVWTAEPANNAQKRRAVWLLDPAEGIGGSAINNGNMRLTSSNQLTSPSGVFTFSYEGLRDGDNLVFFASGYASDSNMNGRGVDQQTRTTLTYRVTGGIQGQLSTGHFVVTNGVIDGDFPTE